MSIRDGVYLRKTPIQPRSWGFLSLAERFWDLTEYLRRLPASQNTAKLSLGRIAQLLGDDLPPSAREWEPWWANDETHVQARAWMAAGWRMAGLNITEERVTINVANRAAT